VLAQGIGRWGNWFNNELFGGRTSLPWGLQIHCLDITSGKAVIGGSAGELSCPPHSDLLPGLYQPTFLYESVWDVALAVALLLVDRRLRLGRGNLMALYVMGYTAGRGWIEALRHDHANHILGLRLNDWTSLVVFLGGLIWFLSHGGFRARREVPAPETEQSREEAQTGVGSDD
jgi:prolipoprotein diacylglyceryltransferase